METLSVQAARHLEMKASLAILLRLYQAAAGHRALKQRKQTFALHASFAKQVASAAVLRGIVEILSIRAAIAQQRPRRRTNPIISRFGSQSPAVLRASIIDPDELTAT
jgi:hypothetical protein